MTFDKTIEKVLVFGYSDNPERYSYLAYNLLVDFNHEAIKFNPREDSLDKINFSFDTLTLYVGPAISDKWTAEIVKLNFKRIIFNPGSENENLAKILEAQGVEVVIGCTLVMLRTGQF